MPYLVCIPCRAETPLATSAFKMLTYKYSLFLIESSRRLYHATNSPPPPRTLARILALSTTLRILLDSPEFACMKASKSFRMSVLQDSNRLNQLAGRLKTSNGDTVECKTLKCAGLDLLQVEVPRVSACSYPICYHVYQTRSNDPSRGV